DWEVMACGADFFAGISPDFVGSMEKDVDDLGVKLAAGPDGNLSLGCRERARGTIRTIGADGVERVCNGEDSGPQGNLFSLQAARVARAVEFLLMGVDDFGSFLQERYPLEHVVATERMLLHDTHFVGRKGAGLAKDCVG